MVNKAESEAQVDAFNAGYGTGRTQSLTYNVLVGLMSIDAATYIAINSDGSTSAN